MKKTKIIFNKDNIIIFEKSNISKFWHEEIVGIFCEHPYLMIVSVNKNKKLIFHSLKEIAQVLPFPFVMCSRSSIVNLTYINQVKSINSKCFIILNNRQEISVSRRKKNDIMEKIKKISTAL